MVQHQIVQYNFGIEFSCNSYKTQIMKNIILFIGLSLLSISLYSQKVYTVDYSSQADVKVYVVDYESQADLCVYKVDYSSQAGRNDGKWFWVDYESQSDKKIYFVDYESQSDLKIYFVSYSSQAGWKNKNKQHLMY
jgi:hypothetical protein